MTVTTKPLIALDFIEYEDYHADGFTVPLFETTVHRSVPIPEKDEIITIGRYEDEDGEELDRWHYMGDEGSYETSAPYRVLQREFHYHDARETDDEDRFVTKRIEVGVTFVVEREPYLHVEEPEDVEGDDDVH